MGTAASGSAVELYYAIENASGVLQPSATTPLWKPIRFNTESLQRSTEQVDSEEINSDRQRSVSEQGTYSVSGEIEGEIYYGDLDGLLEALFQDTFETNELVVGSTPPRIAILKRHTDVAGLDYLYRGCRVANGDIEAVLNSPAKYKFGIVGETEEKYSVPVGSTYASATTTKMMMTTRGGFTEAASALDYMVDYKISMTNGMNPVFTLFQRGAYAIENGVFVASGSMNTLLPSAALYDKYLAETSVEHVLTLEDLAGNSYDITLPDCQYITASKPTSGPTALLVAYTFSAGFDGTTTVQINRTPAA